jgi:transposase
MYYIGVDWADEHHDVCILDNEGKTVKAFRITHDEEGFSKLFAEVKELVSDQCEVIFAMETSQHLLVDMIVNSGYTVYPINPKASSRARDRFSISGAKSDLLDAKVLADMLRTDRAHLRPLVPSSDIARRIKILTRDRESLVRLKTQLVNQLISCLKAYYPLALDIFSDIQTNIALDFVEKFPMPSRAQVLTLGEFKKFLKRHHYPVPAKTDELFQKIKKPQIPVDSFVAETKSQFMLVLVRQLKSLITQIKEYDRRINDFFVKHPDSEIFRSLPGTGKTIAPRLLAEIGDQRQNYTQANALQCIAGTVPVTVSSGNYFQVKFRRACNKHLRDALYILAFESIKSSLWARKYYSSKRAQGKTHSTALRMLANIWIKIIFAIWQGKTLYSEEKFLAQKTRNLLYQVA